MRLEFYNRCAFAYQCAAAAQIRKDKGITLWTTARDMWASWDNWEWLEIESMIIGLENGIDPSGEPVGWEAIEYATALNARIVSTVDEFKLEKYESSLEI